MTVLVIAATDSSGGAGLTRDIRVLRDFSVDALCVVTAVTAQSDQKVFAVHHVPPDIVRAQVVAALATRPVAAIKIGMLGTRATVEAVAEALPSEHVPIVVDPVLMSSSGGVLLDKEGRLALTRLLLPRATLVTPNVPEAAALLGEPVARSEAALIEQGQRLLEYGCRAILVKGGHAEGAEAVDLLISTNHIQRIRSKRVDGSSRGTGCALAAAIAASLSKGKPLAAACETGKSYVLGMLGGVGASRQL
jgi:hydroxymethylpyrimidine/phosphomethylpyrimidine kinase